MLNFTVNRLTPVTLLISLFPQHPMLLFLAVLILVNAACIARPIRHILHILPQDLHSAVSSVALYLVIFIHLLWSDIPYQASVGMVLAVTVLMVTVFIRRLGKHTDT